MDYLLQLLSSYIEEEATLRLVFTLLVGTAVFATGASLVYLAAPLYDPLRRRLADINLGALDGEQAGNVPDQGGSAKRVTEQLEAVGSRLIPEHEKKKGVVAKQLMHAGFRSDGALTTFYALKTILCILFGFIALQVSVFFPTWTTNRTMAVVAFGAYVGMAIPSLVLDYLEKSRIKSVRKGFPDALDLFVVCVESGLGLPATIQKVAGEMVVSHPELGEELEIVTAEMRMGVDRITALRGLAERTGLDEIRGLVSMIDQSARFGTGIAETLRVYSDEFRDKRMQAAEEEAAKIGTKMIFPLILCMWPSFFVVAVGPATLTLIEMFSNF